MPPDIALDDVEAAVLAFREQLATNGRDPADVPISLQALNTPDLEQLRAYRAQGIERVIVGVAMDMWDEPERIEPLMDAYAEHILKLEQG